MARLGFSTIPLSWPNKSLQAEEWCIRFGSSQRELDPVKARALRLSLGWRIPSDGASAYSTWAQNKTFKVDDVLEFNFDMWIDDVAEVTKSGFDSCIPEKMISHTSYSPALIPLLSVGQHYYICTHVTNCFMGQKLKINVTPASSSRGGPEIKIWGVTN
ncbi:hypothetical protein ACFE04_010001 [Oxalis oulophora]